MGSLKGGDRIVVTDEESEHVGKAGTVKQVLPAHRPMPVKVELDAEEGVAPASHFFKHHQVEKTTSPESQETDQTDS